jgi:hypothetical protein
VWVQADSRTRRGGDRAVVPVGGEGGRAAVLGGGEGTFVVVLGGCEGGRRPDGSGGW